MAATLFLGVFVLGVTQVPTSPTGYDNAGNALHQPPPLVSPTWIAGVAVGAGSISVAYAYWNGGLLTTIGIELGALLPLAVFADYGVYRNGLSGFTGSFGDGAMATLSRSIGIALVAGAFAYLIGNELRLRRARDRLPWYTNFFIGRDSDLVGTQMAIASALAAVPLAAILIVPYIASGPAPNLFQLTFAVVFVGTILVAGGAVLTGRRGVVVTSIAISGTFGIYHLDPGSPIFPLLLVLLTVVSTASASYLHAAPAPSLASPALPFFSLIAALETPALSGCRWMASATGPFECSTGPIEILGAGMMGGGIGAALGLLGFLIGAGIRRVAME
jgi:hypothetical protein